jgi:hypothetical protein
MNTDGSPGAGKRSSMCGALPGAGKFPRWRTPKKNVKLSNFAALLSENKFNIVVLDLIVCFKVDIIEKGSW